jgi:hypothetical protein
MATKKKTKRKKATKRAGGRSAETSDEVSRDASALLRLLANGYAFFACRSGRHQSVAVITPMVSAVAGSAMRQDEHRGRRGK